MIVTAEDYFAHFGVKGMRWGHRKPDEPSGERVSKAKAKANENASAKAYIAALKPKKLSRKQQEAERAANEKKFRDKFKPPEPEGGSSKKGLSDRQKTALKVAAVGTVAIGGYLAYRHFTKGSSGPKILTGDEIRSWAGKPISADNFREASAHSRDLSWGGQGFLKPESFLRGEQTLPAGHTFHRISNGSESWFGHSTYATTNIDDFNRYVADFRLERGESLHHISFSTTKPIKIPSLTTALDTMREVIDPAKDGIEASHEGALKAYQSLSGGSWGGNLATRFTKALQEKGYHAIVDETDAGVVGQNPVMIFAKEHLTAKISKPLTSEAIEAAERSLTEITNRKL